MGIKTGDQYLSGLRDGREVWLRGKRIEDVTSEPGLARGARTLATFLDKVHEPEQLEKLTYSDPGSDERFNISFLQPRTQQDVIRRGAAFYEWAKWSHGMFGRTLRDVGDQAALRLGWPAVDGDAARSHGHEAQDCLEERRLARAVGSDDPHEPALLRGHVHVQEDGFPVVGDRQALHVESGLVAGILWTGKGDHR